VTYLNLEVPRNGHGQRGLIITRREIDFVTGIETRAPIDLTGWTIESKAQPIAGDGQILATAAITITDASGGRITITWNGADFDGYGEATALTKASYDIKLTPPSGLKFIWIRGHLHILSESTP